MKMYRNQMMPQRGGWWPDCLGTLAIIGAIVFMLGVGAIAWLGQAKADPCRGCTDPRPNKITITTPSHTYGFACGTKRILDPHTFVFSNCRRRA